MISNFDIFRYKQAGMTNLGINKLIIYYKENPEKISLRKIGYVSATKHLADFIERYKSQDVKKLRAEYKMFPSFSILDNSYPIRLREIYNPPTLLFYQGDLELLKKQKVAFVGSRNATQSGIQSIEKIIKELNGRFVVVSGGARGIDAASHKAAVLNDTPTIAVIGTGLDVFYPSENRKMLQYLAEKHLVLSEYFPGDKPLKYHFPERNRIIAGLSRGVIVAEAKLRSGSLITAERAMEEGRDIFAIPGNILDGFSSGCNHLIQQGAKLVTSANDILEEYDF